jgi:hypothetical protein
VCDVCGGGIVKFLSSKQQSRKERKNQKNTERKNQVASLGFIV